MPKKATTTNIVIDNPDGWGGKGNFPKNMDICVSAIATDDGLVIVDPVPSKCGILDISIFSVCFIQSGKVSLNYVNNRENTVFDLVCLLSGVREGRTKSDK